MNFGSNLHSNRLLRLFSIWPTEIRVLVPV